MQDGELYNSKFKLGNKIEEKSYKQLIKMSRKTND